MSAEPVAAGPPAPRPILKWAGGKTQLLTELRAKIPASYGTFIEPFFGGGALYFATQPANAVIADSNPELVNAYRQVAEDVDGVIEALRPHTNTKDHFLAVRAQEWKALPAAQAAARTIYLNRTCYNGLYRVNKSGHFNVPFGNYAKPRILDEDNLRAASRLLATADIRDGDYRAVLADTAKAGDFVFLDPPYLPVGAYSDFRRYTAEQFYEDDHRELAEEVGRLHDLGCTVVMTNSNHTLVHELFKGFPIEVVQTRRHINSDAANRRGEDVIVTVPPRTKFIVRPVKEPVDDQTLKFPTTRYMGSKSKMLADIWSVAGQFEYDNVVDLFSGSGVVAYMFKAKGKAVSTNDYMAFSANLTKAIVENSTHTLSDRKATALVTTQWETDGFIAKTFKDLYYTDDDNAFIDSMRAGIARIRNPQERAIAMAALVRACLKKRPRGIFTYTGMRYDDGRNDLKMSFADQFLGAVEAINGAVFDNGKLSHARQGDALSVKALGKSLVYMDPPYYTPLGDNEYVRRYHFVEGLVRNWQGVEIQESTLTKKFKSYPTPFSSRAGAATAFEHLFKTHRNSVLLVSYSSNSEPSQDEILELMAKYKRHVDVVPVDYRYSFGTQGHKVGDNNNAVQEYLFVGY